MNQKLEDIKLLLKNDRRIAVAAGFIVVVFVVWLLVTSGGQSGNRRQVRIKPTGDASEMGSDPTTAYGDLIVAFKNDIETSKAERREMFDTLVRNNKDFEQHKERVTGIFETLVDRFEQLSREVDALAVALRTREENIPLETERVLDGPDGLNSFGPEEPEVTEPPQEPQPLRVSVIAPGDTVPVELITGVNAPVDGTPYPVVFRFLGPITGRSEGVV